MRFVNVYKCIASANPYLECVCVCVCVNRFENVLRKYHHICIQIYASLAS